MKKLNEFAQKTLGMPYDSLDERTQKVARHIVERKHISKDIFAESETKATFGQKAADGVANFGGSWTFIILFGLTLAAWVILNSLILIKFNKDFDPYPYILLNLFLSMLASIQAPIILMSQNRQAGKDRLNADHDYEVNLKAELEILLLHEKVDVLKDRQWLELLSIQKEQLQLLGSLVNERQ
ncbi:MAG: DUF1003 domain-containing protein [Desulfoprunum sp.]|nr:DUF1003 domain-containing protein [Desulfoprunum sp.]